MIQIIHTNIRDMLKIWFFWWNILYKIPCNNVLPFFIYCLQKVKTELLHLKVQLSVSVNQLLTIIVSYNHFTLPFYKSRNVELSDAPPQLFRT